MITNILVFPLIRKSITPTHMFGWIKVDHHLYIDYKPALIKLINELIKRVKNELNGVNQTFTFKNGPKLFVY